MELALFVIIIIIIIFIQGDSEKNTQCINCRDITKSMNIFAQNFSRLVARKFFNRYAQFYYTCLLLGEIMQYQNQISIFTN